MLKIRKEIECYDNVMELRPNYPKILYNLGFRIEKKAKEYIHKSKVINKISQKKIKWKSDGIGNLSDKSDVREKKNQID